MTHHTPGPWTAHDDDGTGTLPCVLSDQVNAGGNFYVAQCNVFADARLIAAAPELLAALIELDTVSFDAALNALSEHHVTLRGALIHAHHVARAAIAQATGQGGQCHETAYDHHADARRRILERNP